MHITTIGLDIAKNVFQVHGIDAAEKVVVRKQLRRGQVMKFFTALPPCLVGMEACATAHYWSRELTKLGHEVRLMPAKDVKAYVKRNKNDAARAAVTFTTTSTASVPNNNSRTGMVHRVRGSRMPARLWIRCTTRSVSSKCQ
jgi:transposase